MLQVDVELRELKKALTKSISDKDDADEKYRKEFERVKADADRKLASQKRPMVFDINYWKDAHATAVSRSEAQSQRMGRVLANFKQREEAALAEMKANSIKLKEAQTDASTAKKQRRGMKKEKKRQTALAGDRLEQIRAQQEAFTTERKQTAAFWAEQVQTLKPKDVGTKSGGGNGRTATVQFERHVRGCMSGGASAAAVRQQIMMDARFFCSESQLGSVYVPEEQWFRDQREAMGHEAWLRAMIDVAGAEEVLQYGFDETMIDRQSTMNQWTLMREGGELRVVTIEAGGIMVGGTAQEVSAHTKETWRRGQVGVDMVRQELIKIGGGCPR